jgi:N-acetylneuraminate synthase/N,N'-diacetyllegionaminate synthase
MKRVKIAHKIVGEESPVFIIAEAGVNHNGDIRRALALIDKAAEAGADAVKFQNFKAENIVTRRAQKADYQKKTTGTADSHYQMLKQLELKDSDFKRLVDHAQKKNILFLSTPYDEQGIELLCEIGVQAFKIASAEIVNGKLIACMATKGKPIILSTGMATLGEVEESLSIINGQGTKEIVLLHCITNYPANGGDMNLKAMKTLQYAFRLPVGLSDHTPGLTIPIAAVALGACMIEKHFTLDKHLPGPDHKASLEPHEFQEMVKAIREVEQALGNGVKAPTKEEEKIKRIMRRRIVAQIAIKKGTVLNDAMLTTKRAGRGLEPKYLSQVRGRKAIKNIKQDEAISWANIA